MKKFDIIYDKYLNEKGEKTIGGIQTYITDLSAVILEMGCQVRIIQFFEKNAEFSLETGVKVIGYHITGKDKYQALYDASVKSQTGETITIFATDTLIPKKVASNSIAIQHGIFWDKPRSKECSLLRQVISRSYAAYTMVKRIERVHSLVCVDYNFLNWYRTQVNKVSNVATVIPNYTTIAPDFEKTSDCIKIIFARRLFDYRGTRVFTEAIKRILSDGYNVNVTIAGTGPDEAWMKEELSEFENVEFIQYQSGESIEMHKDKHIAVVPTIGSEGTSLSLLEAMSAQCAVVCSDVGGMTNIVVDGFNGLMIRSGYSDELYGAIKRLINDEMLRNTLRNNAYETVKAGFSHGKWKNRWHEMLKEVIQ